MDYFGLDDNERVIAEKRLAPYALELDAAKHSAIDVLREAVEPDAAGPACADSGAVEVAGTPAAEHVPGNEGAEGDGDDEDDYQDKPPPGRHWHEDKVGLVLTMRSAACASDPCPDIPTTFLDPERAKSELKALIPEDAKEAIGHGVRAKRSKSGAVSFDVLETEPSHAAIQ